MSTKLLKKNIPLEILFQDSVFILLHVGDIFAYKDGERTNEKIGQYYEVVDTMDFEQIRVKIPEATKPLIEEEELQSRRADGEKFFVEFQNGIDVPYLRRNGSIVSVEDSFSAAGIRFVETDASL